MGSLLDKVSEGYKKIVDLEREMRKGIILFNSTMPHAAYITKTLLEIVEKEVRILSGTFYELFYNELKETIENTLKRVKLFRVITIYKDEEEIKRNLKNKFPNFEYISLGAPYYLKEAQRIPHFSVYDNDKWRMEETHQPKLTAESIVKAEACFNDPKYGKELKKTFDGIWRQILEKRK